MKIYPQERYSRNDRDTNAIYLHSFEIRSCLFRRDFIASRFDGSIAFYVLRKYSKVFCTPRKSWGGSDGGGSEGYHVFQVMRRAKSVSACANHGARRVDKFQISYRRPRSVLLHDVVRVWSVVRWSLVLECCQRDATGYTGSVGFELALGNRLSVSKRTLRSFEDRNLTLAYSTSFVVTVSLFAWLVRGPFRGATIVSM